jgi:predicted PurR-regulated permease PerM
MNGRIPGLWLLVPLTIIVLVLVALRLLPLPLEQVFIVVFTAILLASAVAPLASALERYHIPRSLTVLLAYLAALLTLAGVIALIVPLVTDEFHLLRAQLPQYNAELRRLVERFAPGEADRLSNAALVSQALDKFGAYVTRAPGFALSVSSLVVRVVIVLVMAYFMAVEEDFTGRVIRRFTPPRYRPRVQRILSSIGNQLGEWARAQLLLAIFFGFAFGAGLRIVGVPYSVTLGVIGGVLEIIPYVGGFITLVLALLVAATNGIFQVVFALVWYTIVVQVEAHIVAPYLMGRAVGLHPLVVVVALFVGAEALGIFGALLAVPIAVVLQVLLDEFYAFGDDDFGVEPTGSDPGDRAPRPAVTSGAGRGRGRSSSEHD